MFIVVVIKPVSAFKAKHIFLIWDTIAEPNQSLIKDKVYRHSICVFAQLGTVNSTGDRCTLRVWEFE